MLIRLSQAIAITFFLYLITGMDNPTSVQTPSKTATEQLPIGFKQVPQPTSEAIKPKL